MNPRLSRALMILLLAALARDALGFECRRKLLAHEDRRTLEAFVLKSAGIAVDPQSIQACWNWNVVRVDTLRVPQADGTERWSRLSCWATRRSPDRWRCIADTLNGFRADTYPGESGVWVAIATPTSLPLARRLVSQGFELLAGEGTIELCAGQGAAARTRASLRAAITGGEGVVSLVREHDRFSVQTGDVIVYFETGSSERRSRVMCWEEQEVTVTG